VDGNLGSPEKEGTNRKEKKMGGVATREGGAGGKKERGPTESNWVKLKVFLCPKKRGGGKCEKAT